MDAPLCMKKPRPQDARRDLRSLWSAVAVYSCADGTIKIEPQWRKQFRRPGMLTRMHVAYMVEAVLTLPKKRIDWAKSYKETIMETLFDDPIKQKQYGDVIAACKDFDPPLTEDEKAHIRDAVTGGVSIMLRCKFYNDSKPEILFERSFSRKGSVE